MGASPTTCRVQIAQLRSITKPGPLLERLEECALRRRGLSVQASAFSHLTQRRCSGST